MKKTILSFCYTVVLALQDIQGVRKEWILFHNLLISELLTGEKQDLLLIEKYFITHCFLSKPF